MFNFLPQKSWIDISYTKISGHAVLQQITYSVSKQVLKINTVEV